MPSLIRIALIAAVLLLLPALARAEPRVAASIPPVHSLVAGVMEGVGTPTLLVPPTASAHSFSLRPSEARTLAQADLVFWIGPAYETFLEKPLAALAQSGKLVRLEDAPGLTLLEARGGGAWEAHHDHDHEHGAKPDDHDVDGHMFLDIDNAKAMATAIAAALATVDPENAARYRANAEAVTAQLDALDRELRSTLAPVRGRPFVVFHDAYQYFDRRYDLNAVGSITVSPERQPGAKRLQALRKKIGGLKAVCVFAEPQFEPTLMQTVVSGTRAKTGVLDYLGAGIAPGPDHYAETMRALARSLTECLGG
jgi:zinc transport system substrate-binding protein